MGGALGLDAAARGERNKMKKQQICFKHAKAHGAKIFTCTHNNTSPNIQVTVS